MIPGMIPEWQNDTIFPQTTIAITVQDAIARMQWQYASVILITGLFFLLYVLWNNFIRAPHNKVNCKYITERLHITPIILPKKSDEISQEFDCIAFMPALFLVIVGIAYYTGWKGW